MEQQDLIAHCRFSLGQHNVVVAEDASGRLSLWLDGCLRKARTPDASGVYLWTNVELPFEDHHLVEVRRKHDRYQVTVNGELQDQWPA